MKARGREKQRVVTYLMTLCKWLVEQIWRDTLSYKTPEVVENHDYAFPKHTAHRRCEEPGKVK